MHDTDDIGSNNSGNPHLWDIDRGAHRAPQLPRRHARRRGGRLPRRHGAGLDAVLRESGHGAAAAPRLRPDRAKHRRCHPAAGRLRVRDSRAVGHAAARRCAGFRRGCLQHRGRPGAAGRLQSRRHALLSVAEVRQLARPARDEPRVHGRQPDLQCGAGLHDRERRHWTREGGQGTCGARRQRDCDRQGRQRSLERREG